MFNNVSQRVSQEFNGFGKYLTDLEYGPTKLGTLIVLVPIVSFFIHKLKVDDEKNAFSKISDDSVLTNVKHVKAKLIKINECHLIGGIIQLISLVALRSFINSPSAPMRLFRILTVLSAVIMIMQSAYHLKYLNREPISSPKW